MDEQFAATSFVFRSLIGDQMRTDGYWVRNSREEGEEQSPAEKLWDEIQLGEPVTVEFEHYPNVGVEDYGYFKVKIDCRYVVLVTAS